MIKNNKLVLFPFLFLAFVLIFTPIQAAHETEVSVSPEWLAANTSSVKIDIQVKSDADSNSSIYNVGILAPAESVYNIISGKCPSGWTGEVSGSAPGLNDTFICNTTSSFIKSGKSASFSVTVSITSINDNSVKKHNWTCRTSDQDGYINYGNFETVVDNSAPQRPVLKNPEDETKASGKNLVFDWTEPSDLGSGISYYWMQVSNDSEFENLIINKTSNKTDYVQTATLSEKTYYWRVLAADKIGNKGEWSEIGEFVVDNTPPSIGSVIVSSHSIELGKSLEITANNVEDDSGISKAIIEIHYPDNSIVNKTMENSGDDYTYSFKLNNPGVYQVYIIVNDSVGNINKTAATKISVEGELENVKFWSKVYSNTIVTFDNFDIKGLQKLEFKVKSDVSDVLLQAEEFNKKPSGIDNEPDDFVYSYFELSLSNIADSKLSKSTITFSVPKTWIKDNNLTNTSIRLYRYSNDDWDSVSATILEETSSSVKYSAEIPGFSYFAIAGTNQSSSDTGNQALTNTTSQSAGNQQGTNIGIFIAIVLVIFVIGFLVYYFKFRKKSTIW